ncbi:MAG: glycosyltransferase [Candidatus Latescibacteria bacterium]|nr:glycosyltransferase [Candidatus Latescibacterota bacterium]NIM20901.1 glycosyltransferase [Candidatus Latescibacterota bacterium]NIM65036.1 glycosyltransferase [Candidatus Latescibacterota bacterium]NIO01551.1 glycosyltransferase [Candidatus Latescibacterota bacterium]NIO77105.1 glycosyltransferase [Candidatus Latescibacterota bacterium]
MSIPARVLMVDSEETWRGGEAQLELLMKGLGDAGCSPALASPPGSRIGERAKQLGVPTFDVPIAGSADLMGAWRLRRLCRRESFDIIHSHSSHAHGVAFLATVGLRSRPKLLVSRRVDFAVGSNRFSALKYRRGADVYLAISTGVRDVLIACGIERERIKLVPSGIDLGKFDRMNETSYLKKEFSLEKAEWIVGNVAALAPHKSQVDFIEAAAIVDKKMSGIKFLIVGEGELRRSLERKAQEVGMTEKIIFTGFRNDVLEILSTFDCFVLSSRLEGLCTSIMDAQAIGVPVVATNTGGIPDLIEDGETGLLVPPGERVELAQAMIRMLSDPQLRERCVGLAKKKSKQYDYENTVKKTIEVYREVLSGS